MLQEIHLIKFSSILFTESNSLDINSDLLSVNSGPSAPLKNNSQFTSIDQARIECLICPRCVPYPKAQGRFVFPRHSAKWRREFSQKPMSGPAVWKVPSQCLLNGRVHDNNSIKCYRKTVAGKLAVCGRWWSRKNSPGKWNLSNLGGNSGTCWMGSKWELYGKKTEACKYGGELSGLK